LDNRRHRDFMHRECARLDRVSGAG
jgi:hypothetical protein